MVKINFNQEYKNLVYPVHPVKKKKILSTLILEEDDRFFEIMKIGEKKFRSFCNM